VSVPTTVIYFTCYDQLHDAFISKLGEDNDYIPLIAGGIARLFSATIISPVEMIRTRIQSQRLTYKELGACIRSNVAKNGWLSLWKGWGPTVLRDVPFSGTSYFEPVEICLCYIAALLTLPFDVVKTHTQTELWDLDVTPCKKPFLEIYTYEYGKFFFHRLNKDKDVKNH
uniref:Solute carrier family 25 member 40 n=1 Tax=Varanus komodoensis TaxID=61221 RepID=A0A8D2IRV6_VARKO